MFSEVANKLFDKDFKILSFVWKKYDLKISIVNMKNSRKQLYLYLNLLFPYLFRNVLKWK